MYYKNDVRFGTWVASMFFLLAGFGTVAYFDAISTPAAPEPPPCDVCRWTNP